MKNYYYHVHSLPMQENRVDEKFDRLCTTVEQIIGHPLKKRPKIPVFKRDTFSCGDFPLSTIPGLSISYVFQERVPPELATPDPDGRIFDNHGHDDTLDGGITRFGNIAVPWFCCDFLPRMITAFDAYRLEAASDRVSHHGLQHGPGRPADLRVNLRKHLYRVAPISFYDEGLLQRTHNLSVAEAVRRAEGLAPEVRAVTWGRPGIFIRMIDDFTKDDPCQEASDRIIRAWQAR